MSGAVVRTAQSVPPDTITVPNLYYRYYENGELKDKYLGKKIKDEYIRKVEANKKYNEIVADIKECESELLRLKSFKESGGMR